MNGMGNDLIREARLRVAMTQSELARLAGTTQSAIARLESGRTSPSFDDVIRYLRLMGLDLDFMLVNRDDSDTALVSDWSDLTPEQRFDRHVQVSRRMRALRAAGAAAREATALG